jgi:cyclopropane fatty-acyl-phospholipid synthase-like methyltransferase
VTDHPEWWQEFFSGLALDYVRHSRDDEDTFAEADFIQEALELPEGSRLLDVPCGGGRLTLEMASRGYRVIGVDNSPDLIADATSQIDIERSPVTFEQRDMRDLPWQEEFDGAFCFWSSFGYFDDAGNLDFLKAVHNALKPGASLVLDTPLIETRLPEMESQERIWFPVGDLLALEERGFDHVNSRVESEWTFIRGSEVEQKLLSLRLYTYRELCAMLDEAGFGNHQAYGSLDWEPFELGATWLYMVTTKV